MVDTKVCLRQNYPLIEQDSDVVVFAGEGLGVWRCLLAWAELPSGEFPEVGLVGPDILCERSRQRCWRYTSAQLAN